MRFERLIPAQSKQRAIDLLAGALPDLSRQKLKQAMDKGAVWIKKSKAQQRVRRATKLLSPPQALQIYYDDNLLNKTAPEPALVADQEAYSVWDKPAGLLAQGTPYGDHCSLLRFAEKYFQPQREAFLVHRLDTDANGLMLIAHNRTAAARLSELFQQRKIVKRYRVCVEGIIDSPQTINTAINRKAAKTIIEKIVSQSGGTTTLIVQIETGRKHQIRRHLAAIGHPVVGDKTYGANNQGVQLQLQAIELRFDCPINQQVQHFTLAET